MTTDARRALGFFAAVVLLGGGGVLVATRVLGFAAGPENEIITALKRAERDGIALSVDGAELPLNSKKLQFDRFTVRVDPAGKKALATATLDFTGSFGETTVSSLGVEQIGFE
ncbi:MAG: hypothetical protein ACYC8T_34355, partial [Myxococcaceae bacterium]